MRITGGNAARRILKTPKGLAVRPTPDLVKQAGFQQPGRAGRGCAVLELFAGTGALSLDCLSRGAVSAMCIEKSHKHAGFIRANADTANLGGALDVRVQDVFTALAQFAESGRQFDLILADPPYGEKISAVVRLPLRSNSSTITICQGCSRPAGGSFSATPSATRWTSLRVDGSEAAQARRQPDAIF